MIQYALKCEQGHSFDSWFQSASAFDKLVATGLVSCVICGSGQVEKAVMAPRVNSGTQAPVPLPDKPLSTAKTLSETALAEFRAHVEKHSQYVGKDFVREARAMHEGDSPERPIYGEARAEDARKLIEDGVPVAPLPFTPKSKTN